MAAGGVIFRVLAMFLPAAVLRFAAKLRFPQLFLLVLVLFCLDLLIPDFIPFLDELILAVVSMGLAAWKAPSQPPEAGYKDERHK